jgi:DNA-directed RNA polymerase subunit M/transcription elongation factor TFIIS
MFADAMYADAVALAGEDAPPPAAEINLAAPSMADSYELLFRTAIEKSGADAASAAEHAAKIVNDPEFVRHLVTHDTKLSNNLALLLRVFSTPCGRYLETSLMKEYTEGRITIRHALGLPLAHLTATPLTRNVVVGMIYATLKKAVEADSIQTDDKQVKDAVDHLERSVYNSVIERCASRDTATMRSWDNPVFVSYYCERVGNVIAHLDPTSSIVKKYKPNLVGRLFAAEPGVREIAEFIGKSPAHVLCSEGYKKERDIINIRRVQTVKKSTSAFWPCPGCKSRSCTYTEVQDRSSDEPATIYCECTVCGMQYKGH